MKYFILSLVVTLASANLYAETSKLVFNSSKIDGCTYVEENVYATCDSAEKQVAVYEAALEEARNSSKNLAVLIGADWCGPCLGLAEKMNADEKFTSEVSKKLLIVKIGDEYAKAVEEKMKEIDTSAGGSGYPRMYVVSTGKPLSLLSLENTYSGKIGLYFHPSFYMKGLKRLPLIPYTNS